MNHLIDHITFWVPTLISHIAIDLHKLLQDSTVASRTLGRKPRRIMEVAVDIPLMLIIRVLRTKQCRTD